MFLFCVVCRWRWGHIFLGIAIEVVADRQVVAVSQQKTICHIRVHGTLMATNGLIVIAGIALGLGIGIVNCFKIQLSPQPGGRLADPLPAYGVNLLYHFTSRKLKLPLSLEMLPADWWQSWGKDSSWIIDSSEWVHDGGDSVDDGSGWGHDSRIEGGGGSWDGGDWGGSSGAADVGGDSWWGSVSGWRDDDTWGLISINGIPIPPGTIST
ncbi:hypothetical protein B0H17DRAFT_1132100 [Mycena rosella]|uniref:Uncharacterized protein n=1 Tax=Mycena rosella TaxID=1033263 RepID=A0AAD7GGQ4_MYCRO|nr:hypothetical protein B0H17DRAFT_1132100 [Mycena rosella]